MRRSSRQINPLVDKYKEILSEHWQKVSICNLNKNIEKTLSSKIAQLLRSRTKTYRYVLPTQLVAKVADHTLDCRCLQAGRQPATGNFDARTIAHSVIVSFEREQGKPLGGSPEPYVNNPVRVPEVSKNYRDAQKDKQGWDMLCEILDLIENQNNLNFTSQILDQVLLEIRRIQQEQELSYPVPQRISLERALEILHRYLEPRTGGGRLQAVSVALLRTLMEEWGIYDEVVSGPVTAADAPRGSPADIVCLKNDNIVLAVEVKDRTVTLELLEDRITSSRIAKVKELLFLVRATPLIDNVDVEKRAQREFGSGQNVYLFEAVNFYTQILGIVGEPGRLTFIIQVGKALDDLQLDFRDRKEWAKLLAGS